MLCAIYKIWFTKCILQTNYLKLGMDGLLSIQFLCTDELQPAHPRDEYIEDDDDDP